MRRLWEKLPVDAYMASLMATVLLAALFPVSGVAATVVLWLSYGAVALLFFLYGVKLKSDAIIAGMTSWKFQGLVVLTTFLLFPLFGLGMAVMLKHWLPEPLITGIVFLTILPSTIQSSIALTAMARGNVSATICAASMSNVLGVFLTPALAALLLSTGTISVNGSSILTIFTQLLLPFIAGQVLRPVLGGWVERNRRLTMIVDRGSILLIVYSAFSAGMVAGIWNELSGSTLTIVFAAIVVLFVIIMTILKFAGQAAGFPREDQISLLFCGAQKSLASGVPMANILFAANQVSMIILPIMLYHQLQLLVSAAIANKQSNRQGSSLNA